jgi:DNA topoisomerase-1
VYEEGTDQKAADADDEGRKLPAMKPGDIVPLTAIVIDQHFTEPPPRFSEASLVKTLEEYGIGRPSTYASIIQTLLAREYVMLDNRRFRPSDVGRAVAKFLSGHFARYVDYDFTAKLEDELDAVSRGEEDWLPLLERFWKPFKTLIDDKIESVDRSDATGARVLGNDPRTGLPVSVRLGRFGPFAQIGSKEDEDKPRFASLRPGQSMHTLSLQEALDLFRLPRTLGTHEGEEVTVGVGRFGPFVKIGSIYASLKTEDDPYEIDLARALALVQEKAEAAANRLIKKFDGSAIEVVNGRYGPYVTDGEKNGKIPKDVEPTSLSLADCEAIMATAPARGAKRGSGRGAARGGARKAGPEKIAAAKAPAKKVVAKKAAAKKAPAKKAAAKKAPAKKAAAKKTAAKSVAVNEAPPF